MVRRRLAFVARGTPTPAPGFEAPGRQGISTPVGVTEQVGHDKNLAHVALLAPDALEPYCRPLFLR